jgi:hypothetical protein
MDTALIVTALSLFAQAGWSPDRYQTPPPAAAPTSDRYQTAPTATTNGVSPPPSITGRVQNAATETANTLREGFEAGVQAANQQFSQGTQQLYDNTRTAGEEFAQEFQNWAGTTSQEFVPINTVPRSTTSAGQTSNSRGQVSNPFAPVAPAQPAPTKSRNGFAPPPWAGATATSEPDWGTTPPATAPGNYDRTAALGAGPVRTDSGWTSVNPDLAPPPLLIPRLVNTPASLAASQPAASGPSFPSGFGTQPQTERSVMVQNQPQTPPSTNADDGWALGWGNNAGNTAAQPVTIGRYDNPPAANNNQTARSSVQTETVAARPQDPQNGQQSTQISDQKSQFDPWADNNPWAESVKSPQGTPQASQGATIAQAPGSASSPPGIAGQAGQPPASTTAGTTIPPANPAGQPAASNLGTAPPTVPTGSDPPWVPLLVVSLSLAGSIGANLFLGWSYIDARQKYRSLVQKTANTFRRVSAAA